jgi:acyl carrier protein
MPGDPDTLTMVRDAVAVVCEVDPTDLSRQTRFADLGADSLARVSIADVLEARYAAGRLRIDDTSLDRMSSLGELVDYAAAQLDGS